MELRFDNCGQMKGAKKWGVISKIQRVQNKQLWSYFKASENRLCESFVIGCIYAIPIYFAQTKSCAHFIAMTQVGNHELSIYSTEPELHNQCRFTTALEDLI